MRIFIFLIVLTQTVFLPAQKKDTVYCDCATARVLVLKTTVNIGPTISPPGEGLKKEISPAKQNTRFSFEKEHHSAWYKLQIGSSGNLVFDIVPELASDDYDFMLFKGGADDFCDSLLKHKINPVRACISRNKKELNGLTGLRLRYEKEFINEGVGDAFLKPLEVKNGEVYYLVLDNVYKNGEGHGIKFAFEELLQTKGKILDGEGKPLAADISITNMRGDTLQKTRSGNDGVYTIDMNLKKNTNYSLNIFSENTFFYSKLFSTKTKDSLQNLKVVLQKLNLGEKYSIGNINFGPDSDVYLQTAVPTLLNLYKLMSVNTDMKILIIGHTNGCSGGVVYSQKLSERRSKAIRKFLVDKKIDEARVSVAGKGCSEMLFSDTGTLEQQSQNRRVEIQVLEN